MNRLAWGLPLPSESLDDRKDRGLHADEVARAIESVMECFVEIILAFRLWLIGSRFGAGFRTVDRPRVTLGDELAFDLDEIQCGTEQNVERVCPQLVLEVDPLRPFY